MQIKFNFALPGLLFGSYFKLGQVPHKRNFGTAAPRWPLRHPTNSYERLKENLLDREFHKRVQLVTPIACVRESLEVNDENWRQLPDVKLLCRLLMTLAYRTEPMTEPVVSMWVQGWRDEALKGWGLGKGQCPSQKILCFFDFIRRGRVKQRGPKWLSCRGPECWSYATG